MPAREDRKRSRTPRAKKPVQARSRKTRQKLLDVSKELFAEIGFEATTTNLIAARADVSIGTVYAHFEDKWEIFLTLLDAFSREVHAFLKTGVDRTLDERDDLEAVIEWLVLGLYRAHRLNGNLNLEIVKFALKDERAGALRAEWEGKMNEEILRLFTAFRDHVAVVNLDAAVIVAHRSAHEVFQYLYKNRDDVDEEAILAEFVTMLKRYVVG